MHARSTPLAALVLLAAAAPLAAQSAPADTAAACTDLGLARLAVTVPPGQTREEVVDALQQSGALAPGTEVRLLETGYVPPLTNQERFSSRALMHLDRLIRAGLEVSGTGTTLLEVDADGEVTAVHPASGHRDVDRALRDLWRHARFAPVEVHGCRAPAWLHVSVTFRSRFSEDGRQVDIRVHGAGTEPPPPGPAFDG